MGIFVHTEYALNISVLCISQPFAYFMHLFGVCFHIFMYLFWFFISDYDKNIYCDTFGYVLCWFCYICLYIDAFFVCIEFESFHSVDVFLILLECQILILYLKLLYHNYH